MSVIEQFWPLGTLSRCLIIEFKLIDIVPWNVWEGFSDICLIEFGMRTARI